MVELFCARGRHDEIAGAIGQHFGGLVDTVGIDANAPAETVSAIHAL